MGHPNTEGLLFPKVIFEIECKVLQDSWHSRVNPNRTYIHGVVNECNAHAHGLLELDLLPTRGEGNKPADTDRGTMH